MQNMKFKNNVKIFRKVKNTLHFIEIALIVLGTGYLFLSYTRFVIWEQNTTFNKISSHPNKLAIIYRKDCIRCKKTLPSLMAKHALDRKYVYIINVNNLTKRQLKELDVNSTPVFRLKKLSYDTIDQRKIQTLWSISK